MKKYLLLLILSSPITANEPVKLSNSGICHDTDSRYYQQTKNYTPYKSLEACLKAGGRLPNQRQSQTDKTSGKAVYERKKLHKWIDEDGDCLNTRHEVLAKLSTSTLEMKSGGCLVDRGRWNDPYTGKTFFHASDLDVDHLVPLKYAWDHGGSKWNSKQWERFGNDESNLFAVQASVNRSKGSKSPLEWLPPDTSFHCQYVTRFKRIVRKYKLKLSNKEWAEFDRIYDKKCLLK